ncbi:AfsR/SARP family transcriptional regulator [Actinoplanes sp. CA-030573]|uniref:AfsR/SARP family transcriptional regulator n=1 Tax=Actinoplanes sp. CA-030573 TaxID=3239898 RepID=UPI003D91F402
MVRLRLLGPMELRVDGCDVRLGPPRQRTVLAVLALEAGRPVPLATLIDRVWDSAPPADARGVIYTYVARLRRALASGGSSAPAVSLSRRNGGYALDVDPLCIDLHHFEHLVTSGDLDAALALWPAPPLADLSGEWVTRTRARLDQRRLNVTLAWARATTDPAPVIDRLRPLLDEHPLAEPLAALYLSALHRSGRTAEALDHWATVRRHLVRELGTEPGPELQAVHRTLLHPTLLDANLLDPTLPHPTAPAALSRAAPPDAPSRPAAPNSASHPAAPSSLPADTGPFVGRRTEIARLLHSGPGVRSVSGMPGVGKTALVIHVAHRLRTAFPDGQFFVNLHGHTTGRSPADPADVLATLLAADGLDPRRLPSGVEARAALWRARQSGRRTLTVLDNAAASPQVAPLLPAAEGCLVLITSRRFLGDLPSGAVPTSLDVLPVHDAGEMFRRLAPADVGDPTALVTACGHLPLAVALLARLLHRHPGWTTADLLRETRERLLSTTAEQTSIAAAFDLSYRHLPAAHQRFFRLLAHHPGTELEPSATAALAGIPAPAARSALDALHSDSLLIETARHRYTMHDLIRSYARSLARPEPAARTRLLDFYVAHATTANAALARQRRPAPSGHPAQPESTSARTLAPSTVPADAPAPPPAVPADAVASSFPPFGAGPAEALAWLRAERGNLLACLAATREPQRIVALTAGLAELLRRDGPWHEARAHHQAAAALATGTARPHALVDLATMRRLTGDYPGAARDAREALAAYRAQGSLLGEANALTVLAKALCRAAGYTEAMPLLARAVDVYRALDDGPGEAGALVELGVARGMTSDFHGAQDVLREALDRYRTLADEPGEAYALRILGIAHGRVGDFTEARALLTEALSRYRRLDARLGAALTRNDLGRVDAGTGDYPTAIRTLRAALDSHRRLDHPVGQSTALLYLGSALRRAGDLPAAATALAESLRLNREIHNRSGEAWALNELGTLHRLQGDLDRAMDDHREALGLAAAVPSPFDRGLALAGFGACFAASGHRRQAIAQLRTALDTLRRIDAFEAAEVEASLAVLLDHHREVTARAAGSADH